MKKPRKTNKNRMIADAIVAAVDRDYRPGKEYTPSEMYVLAGDLLYNVTAPQRALTGQVRIDPPFVRVKDTVAVALRREGDGRMVQVRVKRKCSITGHQCFAWRRDVSAK
jgi:hypothetical protein